MPFNAGRGKPVRVVCIGAGAAGIYVSNVCRRIRRQLITLTDGNTSAAKVWQASRRFPSPQGAPIEPPVLTSSRRYTKRIPTSAAGEIDRCVTVFIR